MYHKSCGLAHMKCPPSGALEPHVELSKHSMLELRPLPADLEVLIEIKRGN